MTNNNLDKNRPDKMPSNTMLKGQNILCFGSSTWSYPGLQQTIMRLLAPDNKILYVNALGSRNVSLKFSQLGFYLRRIQRQFQPKQTVSEGAVVCNPLTIPLVYNPLVTQVNKLLLRTQFQKILQKTQFEKNKYILWVGTPTAAPFLDLFEPSITIYNPVDRYSAFSFVNAEKTREYERTIAARADAIICTSDAIREDLSPYNKHVFTVTHGVDIDHFHKALSQERFFEEIASLQKPIIGYFGGLSERVNYHLIRKIAEKYQGASVVLLGDKLTNLAELEGLRNVHILGFRDFEVLPHYMKYFSVCLIPYHVNKLMEAVDPIKLREYLCQGKPVVSVDLPEVRKLKDLVYIGRDENEFVELVGTALNENDPALTKARIEAARQSAWPVKIQEISGIIQNAFERKNADPSFSSVPEISLPVNTQAVTTGQIT